MMAKTNYTKVEEALAEGMRKIEVTRLLDIADENAAINSGKVPPVAPTKPSKDNAIHLKRLTTIYHDLKLLEKAGKEPYTQLKIKKEEIKNFIKDPSALNADDWNKVKMWKGLVAEYKAVVKEQQHEPSNEDLIKQQRKQQTTKRFNINEKWIPLR